MNRLHSRTCVGSFLSSGIYRPFPSCCNRPSPLDKYGTTDHVSPANWLTVETLGLLCQPSVSPHAYRVELDSNCYESKDYQLTNDMVRCSSPLHVKRMDDGTIGLKYAGCCQT